ncbi:MAG TPA: ATP-binding protein [Candidatus Acidoferrales bacterium]|nr:ATP-binding protein [Candidatus Acidoferrales bacterium]
MLLTVALAGSQTCAEVPPGKIWQPAPAQPEPHPSTPAVSVPPELAGRADWRISFTTRAGDSWLGGDNLLARLHRGRWTVFASTNHFGPEQPVAFAETADGRLWCATPEGVWQFDGREWLAARSGLDHVHGMLAARDGTLWVATSRGLYRFFRGAWIPNDAADGLMTDDILAVQEDEHGAVYAKTTKGWSRFEPDADTDAPQTEILSVALDHANVREDAVSVVRFRGRDKWDQTPPEKLLFSWHLDEHEWSPFQPETAVAISGLGLGRHVFQVRALDHNGNLEISPAELEFNVVVPWYREMRLVVVLALALLVSLFFAALALNRHRRLQHSFSRVEELVAERTGQLELANRELLHSQKMNALGTLSAGIAHDFNNILSIIKGSAQIIEDNVGNPDKIRARTARIQTVVQQGAQVVEAMLGFSRGNGTPAAPCDLNAVVAETRRLLGDRFLHETEVAFEPAANLPEIAVPRDFVQQILLNFIFNANEAMSGHKRIELSTRLTENLPAEIYLPPAAAKRFVLLSVRDHGTGIAPEIRHRIFEPFFTTKDLSARRGTGLGLSMAYELARKMDAGLAVQSAPGAGSTFTLILPLKS